MTNDGYVFEGGCREADEPRTPEIHHPAKGEQKKHQDDDGQPREFED